MRIGQNLLMAITELFAGIPVADYGAMLVWYERLIGKPPDFFPHAAEAVWRRVDHGWIYVVTDHGSGAETDNYRSRGKQHHVRTAVGLTKATIGRYPTAA
jgi:hypothetical protein